jgi:hypothetical protein
MDLEAKSNECYYCRSFFYYTSSIMITNPSQLSLMLVTQPAIQLLYYRTEYYRVEDMWVACLEVQNEGRYNI